MPRKIRQGTVISNKMEKTVVVAVETTKRHRLYHKRLRRTSHYFVHDAENACHIGDAVSIGETRPLSRLKRWEVLEILRKGDVAEVQPRTIGTEFERPVEAAPVAVAPVTAAVKAVAPVIAPAAEPEAEKKPAPRTRAKKAEATAPAAEPEAEKKPAPRTRAKKAEATAPAAEPEAEKKPAARTRKKAEPAAEPEAKKKPAPRTRKKTDKE